MERRLVVGLGNPGSKYIGTRHNIGFEIVEQLETELRRGSGAALLGGESVRLVSATGWSSWDRGGGADSGALYNRMQLEWDVRDKGGGGRLGGRELICVKPQTFMNRSGEAVRSISAFFKIGVPSILIVHDELDLELGMLRLKSGGGEAGHNGLRSVSEQLGTREYGRLRFGIGRPPLSSRQPMADWVLAKFAAEENTAAQAALPPACLMSISWACEGMVVAQRRFHAA